MGYIHFHINFNTIRIVYCFLTLFNSLLLNDIKFKCKFVEYINPFNQTSHSAITSPLPIAVINVSSRCIFQILWTNLRLLHSWNLASQWMYQTSNMNSLDVVNIALDRCSLIFFSRSIWVRHLFPCRHFHSLENVLRSITFQGVIDNFTMTSVF